LDVAFASAERSGQLGGWSREGSTAPFGMQAKPDEKFESRIGEQLERALDFPTGGKPSVGLFQLAASSSSPYRH
jgi:hypothetical protein